MRRATPCLRQASLFAFALDVAAIARRGDSIDVKFLPAPLSSRRAGPSVRYRPTVKALAWLTRTPSLGTVAGLFEKREKQRARDSLAGQRRDRLRHRSKARIEFELNCEFGIVSRPSLR